MVLHQRGVDVSSALVRGVPDDQWSAPTPCADRDVRDHVGHLVEVHAWVPPIVAGRTVAEIRAAWDVTAPYVTPAVRAAGVFGPEVPVPDDAPMLDRLLGVAGRDPAWAGS